MNNGSLVSYAAYLRSAERSKATQEKYLRSVRCFLRWLGGRELTKEAAANYKSILAEHVEPSTVNGSISALNGFFRMLGREDCRLKFLRVQRRMFRDTERELTQPEYERLVEASARLGRGRTALLLETICGTGVRVSEVRYLTVEAVKAGQAEIRMKGKIRTILFPGKLRQKLLQYARKNKIASGEIFLTRSGQSLSRHQIWADLKALCKTAGVSPTKVFPHNLRHLFARTHYRVHRDVAALAAVLGHSSIETTRIYLLTTGAEHVRQLDRLRLVS